MGRRRKLQRAKVPGTALPFTLDAGSPTRTVDYHRLARLVHSLGPLAVLDAAGGLRSRFKDPRLHPAIRGTAQVEGPGPDQLAELADRGVLAAARDAHRRLQTLHPAHQETVRWLADRAGATVDPGAWALEYGRSHGAAEVRHREAELGARIERFELLLTAERRKKGAITASRAKERDRLTSALGQLTPARRRLAAALRWWGELRFDAAARAWWGEPECEGSLDEATDEAAPRAQTGFFPATSRKVRGAA